MDNGHFSRVNALIDSGWLAKLPWLDLKVWLALHRHSDEHGKSWPSPKRIAQLVGSSDRAVYRALRSLRNAGLLTAPENKGGRSKISKRTLVSPVVETLPTAASDNSDETLPTAASDKTLTINSDTVAPENEETLTPQTLNSDKKRPKLWSRQPEEGYRTALEHPDTGVISNSPKYTPAFIAFWKSYPPTGKDRSSRPQSWAVWKKLGLDAKSSAVMIGLQKWKAGAKWTKDGGAYVEGVHIWLKGEKWEDAPQSAEGIPDPETGFVRRKVTAEELREMGV